MRVTLTPRTYELIRLKLADGRYASMEEVIEAAVTLLDELDDRQQALTWDSNTGLLTREIKSESPTEV